MGIIIYRKKLNSKNIKIITAYEIIMKNVRGGLIIGLF